MDLRWFTTRIYPQNGKEEVKGEGKGEGEEGVLGGRIWWYRIVSKRKINKGRSQT